MRWIYKLPLRFRSLLRRPRVEQELSDELRFHLEKLIEQNITKGMSPEEARYAALRELGGVEQIKEECRDMLRVNLIETLLQDLRYGLRQLRRNPGFTAVAVVILALGIAANTTIFSAVSTILLRKPPVKDPDRLCVLSSDNAATGLSLIRASAPDFKSWQNQNDVFEGVATAETGRPFTLIGKGSPESLEGARVTPDFFKVLGVAPSRGRAFLPSEGEAGNNDVVILSHELWIDRFGSDPNVVGKNAEIDGEAHTIVGVMPAEAVVRMPFYPPQLWTPLGFSPQDLSPSARANHYLNITLGRLKKGVSVDQAQAEMSSIARRLAHAYPETNENSGIKVLTVQEYFIRTAGIRPVLMVLMAAVGLLLMTACANIAGLLMARGAARSHELAVRAAVGAGRLRLIRQMLVESLLVALAGGGSGVLLSVWGIELLRAGFSFSDYGRQQAQFFHLDHRTLLFTAAVCLFTTWVFGLAPALHASRVSPSDALSEGGRTGTGGAARSRLRSILVSGEIAMALVLLAGAGIILRELHREATQDLGFNPNHLLLVDLNLNSPQYRGSAAKSAFFRQVTQKLQELPGVASVGASMGLPMEGSWSTPFKIAGQPSPSESDRPWVDYYSAGPGYFRTMEIPLIKGREFSESASGGATVVAIVNQEFARRFFPRGDAIGSRIEFDTGEHKEAQIVGIVGNAKDDPGQWTPKAQVYESYLQIPFSSMTLEIRTATSPSALAPLVRRTVWSVDKNQPVGDIRTMREAKSSDMGGAVMMVELMGIFAALALILAAVGIYGVIAFSVNQRTREIGIRLALGATRLDVLVMVFRHGALLVGAGSGIGLILALPLPRVLSVVGDQPTQGPLVALVVTAVVLIVSMLATYIPAHRATKIDPMVALTCE
jgi:putative ABC transport system permease protein